MTKDTTNSLSHTRWKCKYHLVFAPKFRRQIVYGKIRGGKNASFALRGATGIVYPLRHLCWFAVFRKPT